MAELTTGGGGSLKDFSKLKPTFPFHAELTTGEEGGGGESSRLDYLVVSILSAPNTKFLFLNILNRTPDTKHPKQERVQPLKVGVRPPHPMQGITLKAWIQPKKWGCGRTPGSRAHAYLVKI